MDFFDNAFTFSRNLINVVCCHRNNTPEEVTCGQGISCAGKCSALKASICPSGECTDDPRTCDLGFRSDNAMEEEQRVAGWTSSDLAWCTSDGCRVRVNPVCCYNPNCLTWNGRKEACAWLNYLTGKGSRQNFFLVKPGISCQPGGGGLTQSQFFFVKLAKTKFA